MRRWNVSGISRAATADPILGKTKFPGLFTTAAAAGQKDPVDFPDESVGKREPFTQSLKPVFKGGHIVGNFYHIVERNSGGLVNFKKKQVRQGIDEGRYADPELAELQNFVAA